MSRLLSEILANMFKGFQSKSRQFNGFPNLNFQVNNEAYGFSGCTFWLDAAYGTNTQTNLAAVSTWQSKIGGIIFTQETAANQPRFILSDSTFNNLSVIQFQDGGRKLYNNNGIGINNFSNTIAWVAKVDTETAINNIAGPITVFSNAGFTQSGNNTVGPQSPGWLNGNGSFYGVSGTYRTTSTLIVVLTTSHIIINGINQTTTSTLPVGFNIECIGGSRAVSSTTTSLIGKIGEFLIFNTKFSQNECETLSSLLNSKYAIY